MATFSHFGQRLSYTEFGEGDRVVVLLHGLLLNQRMHWPLASDLADRGFRVITLDLLGHGESDRPRDMWRYSMTFFGEQTIGLLDHLGVDQAVVMGTSLGANTALEAAVFAPSRLRGMVVEMPVLDAAMVACGVAFMPPLLTLRFAAPAMKVVQAGARLVPRGVLGQLGDVVLDTVRQDPEPSASVLEGLFFGRIAPHRYQRRQIETPSLVIGHPRDPVHPFSDAGMLADELPNGRLLEASSILELRTSPARLTGLIGDFVEECWSDDRAVVAVA
jgi:pimeloyl-ACP methyl ester carboxylesterase